MGNDWCLSSGQILTVLQQLPIPNKTMVKDSKVMSVVHRWASELAEHRGTSTGRTAAADDSNSPPPEKQAKIAGEEADSDASESSGCVSTHLFFFSSSR